MVMVSLLFRDIPSAIKAKYTSLRLIHIATIVSTLLVVPTASVYLIEPCLDISSFMPETREIANSVLSSFLTATMTSAYFKTADFTGRQRSVDQATARQQEKNYIISSHKKYQKNITLLF